MYLGYDRIVAANTVKGRTALTIPAGASGAMIQSETAAVRYTCDNKTDPTTGIGMLQKLTDLPLQMLIEDLVRIRFIRDGAADGVLNIHYFGGRES